MTRMDALIKQHPREGIWLQQIEKPSPGINDVLIKVKKTAICGTDLHIYKWDEWSQKNVAPPRVIGHEYVGTIVEIGSGVDNFSVGERVTGEGHIACGHCRNCRRGKNHVCENTVGVGIQRDGAFAEYVVIPASNVIKINDRIPDEIAAIFDPLGNAVHAALSFPVVGEDVLITGAGLIGSMAVAVCRFAGARHVVASDLLEPRLEIARIMGATMAVDPREKPISQVIEELGMVGFDIGLEMSGSPQAFNEMIQNMYNGSKIALLGILPSDTLIRWDEIIFKALHLKGIYGREMFETWYKMEQMVLSGLDVSPVITHRFPYTEFADAFACMAEGSCGKVILSWE